MQAIVIYDNLLFVRGLLIFGTVCQTHVHEDCQARKLNKEDAMDHCKWRKVIKEAR